MVFKNLLTSTREHLRDRRGLLALFGIYVGILASLALFILTSVATIKQVAISLAVVAVFPALVLLLVATCLGRDNGSADTPRDSVLKLWVRLAAATLPMILLAVIAFQLFGYFEEWWNGAPAGSSVPFTVIRVAIFAVGVPLAIIQFWVATVERGLPQTATAFRAMLQSAFGLRPVLTYVIGIAIALVLAYCLFKFNIPFQTYGTQIASLLVRSALGLVVVFFGLIVTLTASWQKIFSGDPKLGYWTQHFQYRNAQEAGKTAFGSAKNADQLSAVIRNTFIQGTLSIVFALVVIVVVGAAIVVALRAIRGTGRPPAEEDAVPSRIFAPSGLIATPAEKEVQKLWDALPPSPGKSVGTSAH